MISVQNARSSKINSDTRLKSLKRSKKLSCEKFVIVISLSGDRRDCISSFNYFDDFKKETLN